MSAGVTPAEPERLNKLLAHAGVGSRRHCDDLILAGRVTVGGQVVRELGTRVDPETADVFVDAERVKVEKPAYWIVHKPRGYLCTNHDPAGRPRAVDLVEHVEQRVYTVGRLDEASEGLLLLTNDGDLAFRLMHPRFGVEKTYLVQVAGSPNEADLRQLLEGVWIAEGRARARHVKRLKRQGDSTWLKVILCEGKNREIRRMLAKLGHKVLRLKRTAIGPIQIDRLPAGKSRRLKPEEVKALAAASLRRGGEAPAEPAPVAEPRPRPRRPGRNEGPGDERRTKPRSLTGDRLPSRTPREADAPQGERRPQGERPQGERRPQGDQPREARPQGERPYRERGPQGERRPNRPDGDRRDGPPRRDDRPAGPRRPDAPRPPDARGRAPANRHGEDHRRPAGEGDRRPPRRDDPRDAGRREGPPRDRRGPAVDNRRPEGDRPRGRGDERGPSARAPRPDQRGGQGGHAGQGGHGSHGERPRGPRPPKGRR